MLCFRVSREETPGIPIPLKDPVKNTTMNTDGLYTPGHIINSFLSFKPLVEVLKKTIAEGNPGMKKLYGQVVKSFEQHPELLETITDLTLLEKHSELILELLSAVFPPTTANFMYGVAIPFQSEAVYASPLFKTNLLVPGSNRINVPDNMIGVNLREEKVQYACGVILKKYLGYNNPDVTRAVYPVSDPVTGLTRYMELRLDGRFIDVRPAGKMPELPESMLDKESNRLMTMDQLLDRIPLDQFVFEGITPIRVNDVTETAVITEMKNRLLDNNAFSDAAVYRELESFVQSLVGLPGVMIGITPFFRINNHYVYSDLHNENSLLFRHLHSIPEKDEISDYCKLLFRDNRQPVLFETLREESLDELQCLQYYYKEGGRSLIICPLKRDNDLLGMLEIISREPGQLKPAHVSRVESAIPLFTLGLEKSLELLNNNVDSVIKKKFTAVQPAVEWKFTEVALNYIVNRHQSGTARIGRITFKDVYPLYGAIDVRGSSTSRAHAIQHDTLDQLELVKTVVKKAQAELAFPLLQELEFKIDKFISAASDVMQAEEELSIQDFLQGEVIGVFNHLRTTGPVMTKEVDQYFSQLDPALGILYHHRRDYEESISVINDTLAGFIDREQAAAQKVYPHFFERYVTDGLDFNIFIGQSISPRKKFDEIYLHNMKMWQLTILAKAARITHRLEKELKHPLQTTQMILSHSQPLSISFRTAERKFDVDGAYNTRYEIVKKRIDKVRIKDTNERLTQPGKIAVVYSQAKDAEEYLEYIEFLQNRGLLREGIEHHELEELQGVIGLKALRVDVRFDDQPVSGDALELSTVTSGQLLGDRR